jgi:hypothetical protein
MSRYVLGLALLCIAACSQNSLLSEPGGAIDPDLARPPFLNQPPNEGTSEAPSESETRPPADDAGAREND